MKKDNLKNQYRVNEQIRVREVRIVGDDIESTVLPTRDALQLAEQKGVDLVEISPNAEPPVCRLIDYSKFIYQQKKRQKEMKAKQVKVEVKEIRFGPQTDDHDYNFKLKHAQGFLSDGDKVKAYVFFRGRSILFKEQGEVLLLRFAQDLEEYGKVESMPVLEGKRMTMFIAPKKTAPKKTTAPVIDDDDDDDDELDDAIADVQEAARKKPQQKAPKEYTGPKVEGENWDD
ncbi:MAG: translation initiation factor IF-3 [Prevotella sp.]|jgi:translation initiation factor IF-3|nr:translation initiation factor IF-3 [Prevotella sp.]